MSRTHRVRYTRGDYRPKEHMRTDCAGCGQWAYCRNIDNAWLCSTCEAEREAAPEFTDMVGLISL